LHPDAQVADVSLVSLERQQRVPAVVQRRQQLALGAAHRVVRLRPRQVPARTLRRQGARGAPQRRAQRTEARRRAGRRPRTRRAPLGTRCGRRGHDAARERVRYAAQDAGAPHLRSDSSCLASSAGTTSSAGAAAASVRPRRSGSTFSFTSSSCSIAAGAPCSASGRAESLNERTPADSLFVLRRRALGPRRRVSHSQHRNSIHAVAGRHLGAPSRGSDDVARCICASNARTHRGRFASDSMHACWLLRKCHWTS